MSLSSDIEKWLDSFVRIYYEEFERELSAIAQEATDKARSSHPNDFHDITGNLRSSIGAAVYNHGKMVFMTSFETVLGGTRGSSRGKAEASRLSSQYANAITLTIVAGESYAENVEARRDVISGAVLWAESVVDGRMQEAARRAHDRISKL